MIFRTVPYWVFNLVLLHNSVDEICICVYVYICMYTYICNRKHMKASCQKQWNFHFGEFDLHLIIRFRSIQNFQLTLDYHYIRLYELIVVWRSSKYAMFLIFWSLIDDTTPKKGNDTFPKKLLRGSFPARFWPYFSSQFPVFIRSIIVFFFGYDNLW